MVVWGRGEAGQSAIARAVRVDQVDRLVAGVGDRAPIGRPGELPSVELRHQDPETRAVDTDHAQRGPRVVPAHEGDLRPVGGPLRKRLLEVAAFLGSRVGLLAGRHLPRVRTVLVHHRDARRIAGRQRDRAVLQGHGGRWVIGAGTEGNDREDNTRCCESQRNEGCHEPSCRPRGRAPLQTSASRFLLSVDGHIT